MLQEMQQVNLMIPHTINITELCFWKGIEMSDKYIQHIGMVNKLETLVGPLWYWVLFFKILLIHQWGI